MTAVVVVTHGTFGIGLLDAAQRMLPDYPEELVTAVGLMPEDSVEELGERVEKVVKKANSGDGVLVLTDLLGASPFNASARLQMAGGQVAVLTGVNLPMVNAVLQKIPDTGLEELAEIARDAGQKGVQGSKVQRRSRRWLW
jgi:PTS system mannose-specific IIA component